VITELFVRDLGVIDCLELTLGPGMTALTGETGAGKTLLVEALELLVGGRADASIVRAGQAEARVDGRFVTGDEEVVLARAVPANGRSRAYHGGHPVPVARLAEVGAALVDLHGQHAHQSLLAAGVQRAALDHFGAVDVEPLRAARRRVAEIEAALTALGGDERARARELDLLRFQLAELDAAAIEADDEDERLDEEEDRLAGASAHRDAGARAVEALTADGAAIDAIGQAVGAVAGHQPFGALEGRLRAVAADLADVASDVRTVAESIADDPDRLDAVRRRRQLLRDLRRKYGEQLADVRGFAADARARLAELESHDARAAELEAELGVARGEVARAAAMVAEARRDAAPALGRAVERHLHELALPRARFDVVVSGDPPADEVTFLLGANAGEPALPLAKVASGGELARTMLAARLVLTEAPATLVFDEVDAGVGGAAALAVGRALAELATRHQVLVVTHLPQVAAFADTQIAVDKRERDGRTVADARIVTGGERISELSRMLSGMTESRSARRHAEELLATATASRRPAGG
jgi:DNA repair protein RecN (Recombination protein N)